MADHGLWTWGDQGMPAPDKKFGNELRAKARAANNAILTLINQMPDAGLAHSIATVRQEADLVGPEGRANVITAQYGMLRAADVCLLTQLAPHVEQTQADLIAPHISMMMGKISTLQGACAFQEMLSAVYPNTSSRQSFGTSRCLTFGGAVLGVKTAIGAHSEDFRVLFGRQRPIYVVREWPNPMAIVDPAMVSVSVGSSLAQTMQ